jgi:hypothetical protein
MAFCPARGLRRFIAVAAALSAVMAAAPALAEDAPGDCMGFDFDAKTPAAIARVTAAAPKAYFVRNASEDASCPADTAACRGRAYLVPGDLVMAGTVNGAYTCVAYQAIHSVAQGWTNGWIASARLTPVAPAPAAQTADWTGTWRHVSGRITIKAAKDGKLSIAGEHVYPVAGGVRTGEIGAAAKPAGGILAFVDGEDTPFDQAKEGDCLVRMQRVDALLVVEDNGQCGGLMVTFTGFYQRKR